MSAAVAGPSAESSTAADRNRRQSSRQSPDASVGYPGTPALQNVASGGSERDLPDRLPNEHQARSGAPTNMTATPRTPSRGASSAGHRTGGHEADRQFGVSSTGG